MDRIKFFRKTCRLEEMDLNTGRSSITSAQIPKQAIGERISPATAEINGEGILLKTIQISP
jgi:hypothetical protein